MFSSCTSPMSSGSSDTEADWAKDANLHSCFDPPIYLSAWLRPFGRKLSCNSFHINFSLMIENPISCCNYSRLKVESKEASAFIMRISNSASLWNSQNPRTPQSTLKTPNASGPNSFRTGSFTVWVRLVRCMRSMPSSNLLMIMSSPSKLRLLSSFLWRYDNFFFYHPQNESCLPLLS